MGDILRSLLSGSLFAAVTVLVLIIIVLPHALASILINEIMYNPSGTDSKHEWIEIYNNESNSILSNLSTAINLSGYKLFENNVKHSLTLINGSYELVDFAIIADDALTFLKDYPDFNGTLLDSAFSLSNTAETIAILDSSDNVIDNITYNDSLGADNNGRTLVRVNSSTLLNASNSFSNAFVEGTVTKGTPGKQNIGIQEIINPFQQDISLEAYIPDTVNINIEQTKLFRIVNKNSAAGKVYNISVKYNISKIDQVGQVEQLIKDDSFTKDEVLHYSSSNTGSFIPTTMGNYLLCGILINASITDTNQANNIICKNFTVIDTSNIPCNISINISAEKTLYQNEEKIKYDIVLNDETYPFVIQYSVFDMFGDEIKKSQNTTNTNTKAFTPDIDEADRILLIKAELASLACFDNNLFDNKAEMIVLVNGTLITAEKSKKKGSSNESNITIIDVSPDKIKFGQLIKAKLSIYKGNTAKTAVSAYVVDNDKDNTKISRITSSLNLHDKNTFYELTVSILLKDNCDDDFDDGSYKLIVEGLGLTAKKDINVAGITGKICDNSVSKLKLNEDGNLEDVEDQPNVISSSSRKKVEYKLIDYPTTAVSGEKITSNVKIINNDDVAHDFTVYSYVAAGRKSVSGKIKANLRNVTINARDSKELKFVNLVNDAVAAGEYKLRFNFKKDKVKAVNSIVEKIVITEKDEDILKEAEEESDEAEPEVLSKTETQNQLITEGKRSSLEAKSGSRIADTKSVSVIDEIELNDEDLKHEYLSTSEKTKRLLPAFIIITLVLIEIAVIIKKD